MIPPSHQLIAEQNYGYTLSPSVRATYRRHQVMCARLALGLGYEAPRLLVGASEVRARKNGVDVVLARSDDPMNIWVTAWAYLECSMYGPQGEAPSLWRRYWVNFKGLFFWASARTAYIYEE